MSTDDNVGEFKVIRRRLRLCFVLAAAAALGLSCAESGSDGAAGTEPSTTVPVTTGSLPANQLLDGPGPSHVGVATITITDLARDRPLTVYVWFPIDDPAGAPLQRYDFGPGIPAYPSSIAVTAPPSSISPSGPFPLVVISHGAGGEGFDHSGYAEALASYGYIVAAPNHLGDSFMDPPRSETSFLQARLDRPRDVTAIITEMLNVGNEQTADFAANIDPDKIAVMGHSRGGLTAFMVTGGYDNELGGYKPDPRVKAIVALAPGAAPTDLTDAQLAAISVPTLMIIGTDDKISTIDPSVTRPWALVSGRPLYRIEYVAGNHLTFGQFCHYLEYWATLPNPPRGMINAITQIPDGACAPGAMPIDRADVLTNTFVIGFLQSVFRGGPPLETTVRPVPADVIFMVK